MQGLVLISFRFCPANCFISAWEISCSCSKKCGTWKPQGPILGHWGRTSGPSKGQSCILAPGKSFGSSGGTAKAEGTVAIILYKGVLVAHMQASRSFPYNQKLSTTWRVRLVQQEESQQQELGCRESAGPASCR